MPNTINNKWTLSLLTALFMQVLAFAQTGEGQVRVESSARVDEMMAQKIEYNKSLESYQGFKIQIFYGSEKKCYEVQDEFKLLFPDIPTSIIFSTPQWKLQVGNFRTRLEADKSIVGIKQEYPSAIVLPAMIEFDKK